LAELFSLHSSLAILLSQSWTGGGLFILGLYLSRMGGQLRTHLKMFLSSPIADLPMKSPWSSFWSSFYISQNAFRFGGSQLVLAL